MSISEPHYVNLFFFVNLLHSPGVCFFDIWHLFDNFTSFDILTHYLNHLSLSQAMVMRWWSRGTCDMYPLHGVYGPVLHLDLCIFMPICPSPLSPSQSMHFYAHVPHHPCPPSRSMHYYAHVPWPIAHHCCPLSRSMHYYANMPLPHVPHSPSQSIHFYVHVPHHPCPPSRSMHYYAHVPLAHCPSLLSPI